MPSRDDKRYTPRYCRSEQGQRMCAHPFGHEKHRSEDGVEWSTDAKVSYEEAVAMAAREDILWTASPVIAIIYGKSAREVRADIRRGIVGVRRS